MDKIVDYLRLILFTGGVLLGVQVPAFVDQYGKSLKAHLIESSLSLEQFEKDAKRYFDGDLDQLISHYQSNPDPVIQDGGASIDAIYKRNRDLKMAWATFSKSTYSAYSQVLFTPLADIKDEVWRHYTYTIILNKPAIISGLCCGFLLALLVEASVLIITTLVRKLFGQRTKTPTL
jgi:hypothetical protein